MKKYFLVNEKKLLSQQSEPEFERCEFSNKLCYKKSVANGIANSSVKFERGIGKHPYRAYFCKKCGSYHLTSKQPLHLEKQKKLIKTLNFDSEFLLYKSKKNLDLA